MKAQSQNHFFLVVMMMVSILLASMASKAETETEVTCRAKAKEVALQTYQNCASDNRVSRLKEIRDGYKNELAEVKAKYDRMLKEMGPSGTTTPQAQSPMPIKAPRVAKTPRMTMTPSVPNRIGRAERPVSGVARKLPAKQNDNGPALPIQSLSDSDSMVTSSMPLPEESQPTSMSMDSSPQDETGF